LIDSGRLPPSPELIGRRRREVFKARVLNDDRIQVATGEVFSALSTAGGQGYVHRSGVRLKLTDE
jgi:hypothetical protein